MELKWLLVVPVQLFLLARLCTEANAQPCPNEDDCGNGRYAEPNRGCRCYDCSPCPRDAITGRNSRISTITKCRLEALCPSWCSRDAATNGQENFTDVCPPVPPPTTAPPSTSPATPTTTSVSEEQVAPNPVMVTKSIPSINVTITSQTYNSTSNTYRVTCSVMFDNMDTPEIEWRSPSGEALPSQAMEGQGTDHLITGYVDVENFAQEDEGQYTCAVLGDPADSDSIELTYVPPPTTAPPSTSPATPTTTSVSEEQVVPNPVMVTKSTGLSIRDLEIAVSVTCAVLASIFLIGFCWYFIYKKRNASQGRPPDDIEALNLLEGKTSGIRLVTPDFTSGTIKGLSVLLSQPHCKSLVLLKNKKSIGKVSASDVDSFYVDSLLWRDTITILMKRNDGPKREWQKDLQMHCLRIEDSSIEMTSACVAFPPADTFYLKYGVETAGEVRSWTEGLRVTGGSKQLCDLQPGLTYRIDLGVKSRTGDSSPYTWRWQETFTTKCPDIQLVTKDQRATLSFPGATPGNANAMKLYVGANTMDDSKLCLLTGGEYLMKDLIPGMEQVVCLKVKEAGGYRLLKEKVFSTSGSVPLPDDGQYCGQAETDFEEDHRGYRGSTNNRTCPAGFLKVLRTVNPDRRANPEPAIVETLVACLASFFKDKYPTRTVVTWRPSRKNMPGLLEVEDYLKLKLAVQDECGVFDVLKRCLEYKRIQTQEGVEFMEKLRAGHEGKCRFCEHACFLLRYKVQRLEQQTRSQTGG